MKPYSSKSSPWKFSVIRHDMGCRNTLIRDKTLRCRAKPLAKQEMRNANRTFKKSARQASLRDITIQRYDESDAD